MTPVGFALDVDNTRFWYDPVLTLAFYGAIIAGFMLAFGVLLREISPIRSPAFATRLRTSAPPR